MSGSKRVILLIHEDPEFLTTTTRCLRGLYDVAVLTSLDGSSKTQVDDVKPDVIVCDTCTSKVDGVKFAQQMEGKYPLVLVCGHSDETRCDSLFRRKLIRGFLNKGEGCIDSLKRILENTLS